MGKHYDVKKPGICDYHLKKGLITPQEFEVARGIQAIGLPVKGMVGEEGVINFVYGRDTERKIFSLQTTSGKKVLNVLVDQIDLACLICGKSDDFTEDAAEKAEMLIKRVESLVKAKGIDIQYLHQA